MAGSFFDTNVLIYLAVTDPVRTARAQAMVVGGGHVSVQVLNEIASVARRKHHKPWSEITTFLDLLRSFVEVAPLTVETHEMGLRLAQRYGFSVYDAMIVAAALLLGCDVLWSEDMQDGLVVEGDLRIMNPFRLGA